MLYRVFKNDGWSSLWNQLSSTKEGKKEPESQEKGWSKGKERFQIVDLAEIESAKQPVVRGCDIHLGCIYEVRLVCMVNVPPVVVMGTPTHYGIYTHTTDKQTWDIHTHTHTAGRQTDKQDSTSDRSSVHDLILGYLFIFSVYIWSWKDTKYDNN